jgi:histidine triad (HIT) family protein
VENCIFCKIVKGEIPSYKVYEDDLFLAFLNINPAISGQILLIPKKHYRWVCDVIEFDQYWQIARKIATSLKNSDLKPDFVSFVTVGKDVPHAHIHIIPRKTDDSINMGLEGNFESKPSDEEFIKTSNLIKNSLK